MIFLGVAENALVRVASGGSIARFLVPFGLHLGSILASFSDSFFVSFSKLLLKRLLGVLDGLWGLKNLNLGYILVSFPKTL